MRSSEEIPFQPFSRHREVTCHYNGKLPHLRQKGCTYFVTFRLADSLPSTVRATVKQKREEWLKRNHFDPSTDRGEIESVAMKPDQKEEFENLFSEWINDALDRGLGDCVLRDLRCAMEVKSALQYYDRSQWLLGDFVIMPNHVHVLITPIGDHRLEVLLKSIKGVSARRINAKMKSSGSLWQKDSYDHIVRTGDELRALQKYIRNNPANAGLDPKTCLSGESDYIL